MNLAEKNPQVVKELSALLEEWYVPNERQAGKFMPVAPERTRKPKNR